MTLLSIENLSISFSIKGKEIEAVRAISFHVDKGEIVAIVGESGCGKSSTAKAIANLLPFQGGKRKNGKILFNERDLTQLSEKEWRKIRGRHIGMLFQDPMTFLNPTMKIGHQIAEGYLLHRITKSRFEAKKRALSLMRTVGIPDPEERFEQYPHTLSGGLRQRVCLAIALAPSPSLLLADEPTTSLDVTIQAQILDLLLHLKEELGMSILLITHDLGLVAQIADRVLVMQKGEIVESAPVYELFASPKHPYTQMLLSSIPRIEEELLV